MKRKTVVLIGLLFAFAGAAQAAAPDIYDLGFPDDSKDTTVNVLELNAGQDHTLDTTDDVDRAVLVLTGEDTYPYTVRVEQVGTGIDPAFVVLDDAGATLTTDVFTGDPGFHDAYLPLGSKWIDATKAWHVNNRVHNYTLVMLQIGEGEGGDKVNQPGQETFSPALSLVLEMRDNPQDSRVPDLADVPGGYRSDAARVMVWDAPGQVWQVYDPAPTHVVGGVFTTPIFSIAGYVRRTPMQIPGGEANFHEVYFALEPLPVAEPVTVTEPVMRYGLGGSHARHTRRIRPCR